MKNQKSLASGIFIALSLACLQTVAVGQTASQATNNKVANVRSEGMGVRFESAIPYSSATLTVSAPDGNVYRREFGAGSAPSFALFDKTGAALGSGQYTYELTFITVQMQGSKKRLTASSLGAGGIDENGRTNSSPLSVQSVVQSGSFAVQNGTLYVGNETEPTSGRAPATKSIEKSPQQPQSRATISGTRLRNHRLSLLATPDQVIADDLIVQGSGCFGFDCVNNESFGFDTIRLKENNTRIGFDDTSVGAFPANDWQLVANDSASGGASKFSIEDITGAKVPFTITAGAATNSIFVNSIGKVGFRTSTPVLDLHITTGDTPAHQLEQTSASGFTAQTWDIGGNEANFFIRDVTGGSRLPLRIRPGAPTSSIDINASGLVGIGTASPTSQLHIFGAETADTYAGVGTDPSSATGAAMNFGMGGSSWGKGSGFFNVRRNADGTLPTLRLMTNGVERIFIDTAGNVGIATTAPADTLSVNGTASKPGGGFWAVFSDERLKNIKGRFNSGLKAVMQLQPIRYQYKPDNALGLKSEGEQVGFGARALQKVIPEAVTQNASGYLMVNNDPILWTMLNAIKEQQKEIAELKSEVRRLRAASYRRRK